MKKRIEGFIIITVAVLAGIGAFVFMGLETPLFLIIVFIVMLGVGISVLVDGNRTINRSNASRMDHEIVNSSRLHEEVNQEPVVYHWTYKLDDIDITETPITTTRLEMAS